MPYTERSKENLVREGIARERIFVTGNPIYEVLGSCSSVIATRDVWSRLGVSPQEYFLVTLHRAENVDRSSRLDKLFRGLSLVADTFRKPVIVSVHPRTADKLAGFGVTVQSSGVRLMPPLGFFDFVSL